MMSTKQYTHALPDEFHVFGFHQDLLGWYDSQKRDLPWRINQDPYRIWVSEIMLQQTRVETVKPFYHNFMDKFPTIQALAEAPEDEVLKAWEGLGYYSRARNLQAAAREVQARYGGIVPDTRDEILKLKGVGSYTAGAILSIAYEKSEPAVDGNVMRVFSRLLYMTDDIGKASSKVKFEELVRQVIPAGRAGDFNQALMELGALICLPRNPQCLTCPVFDYCLARKEGVQDELPVKGKAKPPKAVHLLVTIVARGDEYLINKRPEQGLLAGLWEFPMVNEDVESDDEEIIQADLLKRFGVRIGAIAPVTSIQHTFSHLQWNLDVYRADFLSGEIRSETALFVPADQLDNFTFSVAHSKIRNNVLSR